MKMKIANKLALLLLVVSLLPLIFFGVVSVRQVRQATVLSVTQGNENVSRRAAAEIDQYVRNALSILEATAENLNHADLKDWQRERILKNYLNRFEEFNQITIRNLDGSVAATTRLDTHEMMEKEKNAFEAGLKGEKFLSPVIIKGDLTPALVTGVPIRHLAAIDGVMISELNLLHMWSLVDGIQIGKKGILHVMDAEGRLIATGDGRRKKDVFDGRLFEPSLQFEKIFGSQGAVFENPMGESVIAVGTRLKAPLSWSVIVEQPTSEAYALATRMGLLLAGVMGIVLLGVLTVGIFGGGRQVVSPIRALTKATDELSRGNLDYRVHLKGGDEFSHLGDAFNQMAIRLKEIQEKLIREEKHALFGRIASGLAHDLKHPVQAIQNVSQLMEKFHDDPDFRATFRRTVGREFEKINLFLHDLHHLTHDIPFQPVPLKLRTILQEAMATFEMEAQKHNVQLILQCADEEKLILGDTHSLNRVFSNLISNSIQAMDKGGSLTLSAVFDNGLAQVDVRDTGMGIPAERMATLFDDFVTTKRKGLGLGLAVSRKIILQHGGTIRATSQVGLGTCFSMTFSEKKAKPA